MALARDAGRVSVEALAERFEVTPQTIRLRKRIPSAAGLGGGSANAATVLAALPRLFGREPDPGWLEAAARRLGADVPYFLVGGLALGLGRGDEIVPLADPPDAGGELWLALPREPLSTADVFAAWCNDRGGINGRKIEVDKKDSALTQVQAKMTEACADDFMMVGGGAVFGHRRGSARRVVRRPAGDVPQRHRRR